jgi:hypothetical protein
MEHLVRGFNGRIECPWAGVLENSRVRARNEIVIWGGYGGHDSGGERVGVIKGW